MRKLTMVAITLLALTTIFSSCNKSLEQKTDDIIKKEYVVHLKDPSSYSKISTEIVDTVYGSDTIININHKFKALNGMGLLAPGELNIEYSISSNRFVSSTSKRIFGGDEVYYFKN